MRVCIICGFRSLADAGLVDDAVTASGWSGTIAAVIHGAAPGVDAAAGRWGDASGLPVEAMPADWHRYGRAAGMRRNAEMATRAAGLAQERGMDACCIAIPGPGSIGTWGMVELCKHRGIPCYVAGGRP